MHETSQVWSHRWQDLQRNLAAGLGNCAPVGGREGVRSVKVALQRSSTSWAKGATGPCDLLPSGSWLVRARTRECPAAKHRRDRSKGAI